MRQQPPRKPQETPEKITFTPDWGLGACTVNVQTIIDALPFYVILVDSAHTVLMANRAVRESLGLPPEAIIGGFCPKLVHGRDDSYPGCPLESACANGCSTECELVDKERGSVMVSGVYETPLLTKEGRRVYLHTARDITEQRKAEDALAHSERSHAALNQLLRLALEPITLEELFEKSLDIIMALPWARFFPQSIIFLADAQSKTLVPVAHRGLDLDALTRCSRIAFGECVCGLAAQTRRPVFVKHDDPCHSRRNDPASSHAHYCAPMGHGEDVLGVLTLYLPANQTEDPHQLQFVASAANVLASILTCRRAEEARLVHERIALTRERMARVGEIATGVAHLVRNPLQGAMHSLDILEENLGDLRSPGLCEPIAMAREGLARISKVTERLLTLTRDAPFRPRLTDVVGCLGEARAMLDPAAAEKRISVALDVRADCRAELDPDRFVEAVTNVLGNAIDASHADGNVTVRARLVTMPDPAFEVIITDAGIGMTEEVKAKVFDPFFSTKPIGKGSGLGLAITKRIVDEHGGTIDLASQPGRGTTVTLIFPQRSAEAQ